MENPWNFVDRIDVPFGMHAIFNFEKRASKCGG